MNWQRDLQANIEALVLEHINLEILELIEVHLHKTKSQLIIQVTVDRLAGGITIDECADANRFLSNKLEELNIIDGDYAVEVSSPGLDRPLKTLRDFQRVLGKQVRFHLSEMIHNKLEWSGIVVNVEDNNVIVQTKRDQLTIPVEFIAKAFQIIN